MDKLLPKQMCFPGKCNLFRKAGQTCQGIYDKRTIIINSLILILVLMDILFIQQGDALFI